MVNPIAVWHEEHVYFGQLLRRLRHELDVFHGAERPNYELMLDIVTYLRDYGDQYHHPREDEAFARLARRAPELELPLARLKQEKLRPLVPSLAVRSASTNPAGTLGYGAFGGGGSGEGPSAGTHGEDGASWTSLAAAGGASATAGSGGWGGAGPISATAGQTGTIGGSGGGGAGVGVIVVRANEGALGSCVHQPAVTSPVPVYINCP